MSGWPTAAPPSGYRRASAASGLLVPEDTPREREVWTKDEWKTLNRAIKLLALRGIRFQFACEDERCRREKLELLSQPDGSFLLRCAHKDRILSRAL